MSDKEEPKIYNAPADDIEGDMNDFSPCSFCPMMRYCPMAYEYDDEMEDTERQYHKPGNYPKKSPGKYPHYPKKHPYYKKKHPFPYMYPYMFPFLNNNWDEDWDEDSEDY